MNDKRKTELMRRRTTIKREFRYNKIPWEIMPELMRTHFNSLAEELYQVEKELSDNYDMSLKRTIVYDRTAKIS